MLIRTLPGLAIRPDFRLEDESLVAQALLELVETAARKASQEARGTPCVVVFTQDRGRPAAEFSAGDPPRSFAVIVDGPIVELVEHLTASHVTCERTNKGHARPVRTRACACDTACPHEDPCTSHATAPAGPAVGPCVGDPTGHRHNLVHRRVDLFNPDSLDVIEAWVAARF